MTWVRLDDNFADHPKVAGLSDAAFRLHVAALCYCGRHLTDGVVPASMVVRLTTHRKPGEVADELVGASLWERSGGGFVVRDFCDFNPTRAKVLEDREASKVRQQRARDRRRESRRDGGVTGAVSHAVSSAAPTRPDPSKETTNSLKAPPGADERSIEAEPLPSSAPEVQAVLKDARRRTNVTPMFKKDPA